MGGHTRRRVRCALAVVVLAAGSFVFLFGSGAVFSQGELPVGRTVTSIIEVRVFRRSLVQVDDDPLRFVGDGLAFRVAMSDRGYRFVEQHGSGYLFERRGRRCYGMSTAFTSRLQIFIAPDC